MPSFILITLFLFISVIVVGYLIFRWRLQVRSADIASSYSKMVMPLWAIMGPHQDGTSSAFALGLSLFTVTQMGDAQTLKFSNEKIIEMMESHRQAFEERPNEWADIMAEAEKLADDSHYALLKEIDEKWKDEFEDQLLT